MKRVIDAIDAMDQQLEEGLERMERNAAERHERTMKLFENNFERLDHVLKKQKRLFDVFVIWLDQEQRQQQQQREDYDDENKLNETINDF